MRMTINTNFPDIAQRIRALGRDTPAVAAVELSRTARDVQAAIRTEMSSAFDRPVNYTLNSMFVKGATQNNLEARVWIKDNPFGKGTPADRYLGPQIFGGVRTQKVMERRLQRAGVLPAGWHTVPGEGAEIDAYGNMSRGQIVKVLSWLQAFSEQGFAKNSTKETRAKIKRGTRSKRGMEYFVSSGKGSAGPGGRQQHLPPGVWSKTKFGFGKSIKPVLIFVKPTSYQPRLKFFEVGEATFQTRFPINWESGMEKAIERARLR